METYDVICGVYNGNKQEELKIILPKELLECMDKIVEYKSFENRNDLIYHALKLYVDRIERMYVLKKEL